MPCAQVLGELLPEVQARLMPQLEVNFASWKAVETEEASTSFALCADASKASSALQLSATTSAIVVPLPQLNRISAGDARVDALPVLISQNERIDL